MNASLSGAMDVVATLNELSRVVIRYFALHGLHP